MAKAELYDRYPISSVLIYNSTTIIHFLIGGLIIGYSKTIFNDIGSYLGLLYIALSMIQMYILMPFQVCKNCVYYKIENSLCISGLNVVSKTLVKPSPAQNLSKRAQGLLCPNNLYIASLVFPILCAVPLLINKFSTTLLLLELFLFTFLIIRFFYIIPQLACVHCRSKFVCPQAGQMGVRNK
jgi:hypothetical protein